MNAIWSEAGGRPRFAPLDGSTRTDVLIIGGGLGGLLCAYMLRAAGVDCLLVEAGEICGGVTKNTTAKITLQHGLLYDRLLRSRGEEIAGLYLRAQREAMARYHALCGEIDCDYEEAPAYVYDRTDRGKIEREAAALERLGQPAAFTTDLPLPVAVAGAVRVAGQAQFHPLQFAYAIARGLPICENTRVLSFEPGGVRTDRGRIAARQIIVATHFPMLNKHGAYFLKLYQHRSYVLALEGADPPRGMYVDADPAGLSFRRYNGLLLLGGGGHRTGKPGGGWQALGTFAQAHYPGARVVRRWATQDCMTLDGVPYIGPYARRTPGLYVCTGFNKWGMTSAMVSAMLLTDLVQGRQNDYAVVFSPSRGMLHPQLAINAGDALLGLLTPTAPRCPHMGCALRYNPQEHSWDCPCHGSRFGEDGRLLDNPANADKKNLP